MLLHLLLFWYFFMNYKVLNGKELYLSVLSHSKDTPQCGLITILPCRSLVYTLQRSDEGDVINVDGGRSNFFVYKVNSSLSINHSITIQQWNFVNKTTPKPFILFENKLSYYFKSRGNLTLKSLNFNFYPGEQIIFLPAPYQFSKWPTTYIVKNCRFFNNFHVQIKNNKAKYFIKLENTTFSKQFHIIPRRFLIKNIHFLHGTIMISGYKFHISDATVIGGLFSPICSFELINSTFYETAIKRYKDVPKISGLYHVIKIRKCTFDNSPVLLYEVKTVLIYDSLFKNIDGYRILPTRFIAYLPALYIDLLGGYELGIERTLFVNNSRNTWQEANFVLTTNCALEDFHPSNYFKNVSIIAPPNHECLLMTLKSNLYNAMSKNMTLQCPIGYKLIYNVECISFLCRMNAYRCISCDKSEYGLKPASFKILSEIRCKEKRNLLAENVCQPCPVNGICNGTSVRSKGGYWGYKREDQTFQFIICPEYYCCATKEKCISYNICEKNREGRLCGDCKQGYSTSLNGNFECVSNQRCHNQAAFFILLIIIVLIFTLLLLYLKEVILLIKHVLRRNRRKSVQQRSNEDSTVNESDDEVPIREQIYHECFHRGDYRDPIPYQILTSSDITDMRYVTTTIYVSGMIKILFFYYQAASIIRTHTIAKVEFVSPKYLAYLLVVFNIRAEFSESSIPVCILPNLSVIHAEITKLSIIFGVFFLLIVIWISVVVYEKLRKIKTTPNNSTSSKSYRRINSDVPMYSKMPILARVKCAYIQFLLISFSSLSTFLFRAVLCINISEKLYMYIQASTECYQPWQYVLIVVIVSWTTPFFVAIYVAGNFLYYCSITPNEFLFSLTFPPALVYFSFRSKCLRINPTITKEDAILANHMLLVINEPFKEDRSNNDGSRICWESVLILRRMVLVVLKTFIFHPISKLYPIALMLLVFKLHHTRMQPFSANILNRLETCSLYLLISLVFVNLFWACASKYDLMKDPKMQNLGIGLIYYETLILALPILIPILYGVYRLCKKAIKIIYGKCNA